jgi:hypothetical protein
MASKIDAASADPPCAIQPHRILLERGLSVYAVWAIRSRVEREDPRGIWERMRAARREAEEMSKAGRPRTRIG